MQIPLPFAPAPDYELADMLAVLARHPRALAAWVALGVVAAGVLSWRHPPRYQAVALVEPATSPRAARPMGGLLAGLDASRVSAEAEWFASRNALDAVADALGLDVIATPVAADTRPAALTITRFDVDGGVARTWHVTALPDNGYELRDADGKARLRGTVGAPAVGGGVRMQVAAMRATPGQVFSVVRRAREETLHQLHKALGVREAGRASGLMAISLLDVDPARARTVLAALVDVYIEQSRRRRHERAGLRLATLSARVPVARDALDSVYRQWIAGRTAMAETTDSRDLAALTTELAALDAERAKLAQTRIALGQRFGPGHPARRAVEHQEADTLARRLALAGLIAALQKPQGDIAQLDETLRESARSLARLTDEGQQMLAEDVADASSATVIDHAYVDPTRTIGPGRITCLLLGAVGGFASGAMFLLLRARRAWRRARA
jgi:tyrosine-protein kinase Etk/Wzc